MLRINLILVFVPPILVVGLLFAKFRGLGDIDQKLQEVAAEFCACGEKLRCECHIEMLRWLNVLE
jgi:hypothetical protein